MGLDWNPGNRPKLEHEREFFELFELLRSNPATGLEKELERFFEISISAYETLEVPQVGIDQSATEWIKQQYHIQESEMTIEEWVERFRGFFVVPLVPPLRRLAAILKWKSWWLRGTVLVSGGFLEGLRGDPG